MGLRKTELHMRDNSHLEVGPSNVYRVCMTSTPAPSSFSFVWLPTPSIGRLLQPCLCISEMVFNFFTVAMDPNCFSYSNLRIALTLFVCFLCFVFRWKKNISAGISCKNGDYLIEQPQNITCEEDLFVALHDCSCNESQHAKYNGTFTDRQLT